MRRRKPPGKPRLILGQKMKSKGFLPPRPAGIGARGGNHHRRGECRVGEESMRSAPAELEQPGGVLSRGVKLLTALVPLLRFNGL